MESTNIDNQLNHNNNSFNYIGNSKMIQMKGYPINGDTITGNNNHLLQSNDTLKSGDKLATNTKPMTAREIIFQDVNDHFDSLNGHLKSYSSMMTSVNYKEMESSLIILQQGFRKILSISSHYEYKHLPANGFITYCVMVRSWLIKCCQKLSSTRMVSNMKNEASKKGAINSDDKSVNQSDYGRKYLQDINIVIKGFVMLKDLLVHFHQVQSDHYQSQRSSESINSQLTDNVDCDVDNDGDDDNLFDLPMFSPSIEETVYQLKACFQSTEFQEALARSFCLYWLSSRTRSIVKLYLKGTSWTYANFIKSFKVLANKRYRCKTFVKLANRANMGFPFDMAYMIDGHLVRKLFRNLFYHHKDAVGTNFLIPRQGNWFIPSSEPGINHSDPPVTNRLPIRVRLIRHRSKPVNPEVLIFHCHGSGFILSRPDIHDGYLKPWVAQLDGVSVLSVDYSLRTSYPQQFQDVLDAYLWVTSGDQMVKEKIGFHPKKIILIGDSAGSMLAMSIPFALHEIDQKQRKNPNMACNNIVMPVAFISFYGTFHLSGAWSSSRIMSLFDPILHYGNILAIAGCLSGIQGRLDDDKNIPKNRIAKVSSYIAEDIRIIRHTIKPRNIDPWYISDGKLNADRMRYLYNRLQSPYLNSATFDSFEALKDISLCLITSFGCIFLDDNIELARSWKGQCEVHVLESQIHGFLFMRHERAAIKFADDKVVQFVNQFTQKSDEG